MKLKHIILLSVAFISNFSFAQNRIEGKIINNESLPLPLSIVFLKVQDSIIDYSFSDFDGKFIFLKKYKQGMYLETHFIDEVNILKLDTLRNNLLIKMNFQNKVSKEQLYNWHKEMFKKYKLEYKEE